LTTALVKILVAEHTRADAHPCIKPFGGGFQG
jgi:hypothetical protein